MPACSARVAQPCLRSCSRIRGSPILATLSPGSHARTAQGAARSRLGGRRQGRCRSTCAHQQPLRGLPPTVLPKRGDSATVKVTVRRPFAVFGVPIITVCLIAMTVGRIDARPASRSRSDPPQSQRFATPQSCCGEQEIAEEGRDTRTRWADGVGRAPHPGRVRFDGG
jgi:hypothetical protein